MYRPIPLLLTCLSAVQCANILGAFLFPSISHQSVYQPIWRELSLRGHNVTVITPEPLNDPTLTNLTEISVRFAYKFWEQHQLQEIMSKDRNMFQVYAGIYQMGDTMAETQLNSTEYRSLIQGQDNQFDLVLIEPFALMYALGARFRAPVISISPFGMYPPEHEAIGNPTHPVLYPDHLILNFPGRDLSLWERVRSTVFDLWMKYHHWWVAVPRQHELAKKYFGDDVPYLGDLERNHSMLFLNVNPSIYPSRSNVPAVLEIGRMHVKPVKPLPQDLKLVLDGATEGAVFFSLGSTVRTGSIDGNLRHVIVQALAELPYKVLLKWDGGDFEGKPPNVVVRRWFPQQDVLGHPNVRAFVTQGGLQSVEEGISRGVPLVGMPFLGDQNTNVGKIVELGIGVAVDSGSVSKDQLKESIMEVVENPNYSRRIREVYHLLYDKPMNGLEKAVWWSEYVIRHRGAKHLRSPTANSSFSQYLLLDIGLAVAVQAAIVFYASYKTFRSKIY